MKKTILALIVLLAIATSTFAAPKIYVPEQYFDFGYAPQNSALKHDYWIKNIGTDTLKITRVKPG